MRDKQAKSFIVIIIAIALCALLLKVAIENIIKINITQNESTAQATLKLISTALENFAKDNKGAFPTGLAVLTQATPPYLDKDYIDNFPLKGYNYNCSRLDALGYSCSAIPAKCNLTGKTSFTISTGNLFISEECDKKE